MSYETFTNKVAMTFKPSGKVGINIRPGLVIDGATVVEVTNTGERVEVTTSHGDVVGYEYDDEFTALVPYRDESDGRYWVGCSTCHSVKHGGGFGPSHKASGGCRSGGRVHCTCDGCW